MAELSDMLDDTEVNAQPFQKLHPCVRATDSSLKLFLLGVHLSVCFAMLLTSVYSGLPLESHRPF